MTDSEDLTFRDLASAFIEGAKTGYDQSVNTAAADHGVSKTHIVCDMVSLLANSAMMWRAAKRGDVAKTIAWSSVLIRRHAGLTARRQRVLQERQMDTLIDRSIR